MSRREGTGQGRALCETLKLLDHSKTLNQGVTRSPGMKRLDAGTGCWCREMVRAGGVDTVKTKTKVEKKASGS